MHKFGYIRYFVKHNVRPNSEKISGSFIFDRKSFSLETFVYAHLGQDTTFLNHLVVHYQNQIGVGH